MIVVWTVYASLPAILPIQLIPLPSTSNGRQAHRFAPTTRLSFSFLFLLLRLTDETFMTSDFIAPSRVWLSHLPSSIRITLKCHLSVEGLVTNPRLRPGRGTDVQFMFRQLQRLGEGLRYKTQCIRHSESWSERRSSSERKY